MDLPVDIKRVVGAYATGSLFDLASLLGSGFLRSHSKALEHISLEFQDVTKAAKVINQEMFGGVRVLKLDAITDHDLQRLVALAPRLAELDLGHCRALTCTQTLGRLSHLNKLTMMGCRHFDGVLTLRDLELTQCGPVRGDLRSLHSLKLHSCTIEHPVHLGPDLEYLELNANHSEHGPVEWSAWDLGQLTKLTVLKLTSQHSLTNSHLVGVSRMHDLHRLHITSCSGVTDFSFLEGLSKLRHLQVSNTFDWAMLKHVELESFSATEFTLAQLRHLGTQRRLEFLRIDQGRGDIVHRMDPGPVLSSLLPQWPHLRMLDLFFCTQLIDTSGFTLCTTLKCLKIDFCKLVDNHMLEQFLHCFPQLEVLSIKFTRVTDAGLEFLPTRIHDLALRGCAVTDQAIPYLSALKNLTVLDISYTKITQVYALPASLKTLYVTGSNGLISPDSLLALGKTGLTVVHDY